MSSPSSQQHRPIATTTTMIMTSPSPSPVPSPLTSSRESAFTNITLAAKAKFEHPVDVTSDNSLLVWEWLIDDHGPSNLFVVVIVILTIIYHNHDPHHHIISITIQRLRRICSLF